jgi:hypothetical protein
MHNPPVSIGRRWFDLMLLSLLGNELHSRRSTLANTLANPNAAEPFPVIYSFVFSSPVSTETYFYINPAKCSLINSADRVGSITVVP